MFVHFSNQRICKYLLFCATVKVAEDIKDIRAMVKQLEALMKERQTAMAKLKVELEFLRSEREGERCT